MDFEFGKIYLTQTNISYCRTESISGYQFNHEDQAGSNFTYNSIVNNTADNDYCFFTTLVPNVNIFHSNIYNNSATEMLITIDEDNTLKLQECNLVGNSATYIIYTRTRNTMLQLSSTYIQNNGVINGENVVVNPYVTQTRENNLKHLSEELCKKERIMFLNRHSLVEKVKFIKFIPFFKLSFMS